MVFGLMLYSSVLVGLGCIFNMDAVIELAFIRGTYFFFLTTSCFRSTRLKKFLSFLSFLLFFFSGLSMQAVRPAHWYFRTVLGPIARA